MRWFGAGKGLVIEIILSFFLVLAVFATAVDPGGNFWGDGWIYYVGPAIGGVIAAVGYDWPYLRSSSPAVAGTS